MVAASKKSKEDEAVEKSAKAVSEAEEKRVEQAATAASASQLEAKAAEEVRLRKQAEYREEVREEVEEAEEDGEFGGQLVSSENFIVVTSDDLGRNVIEIRPTGWVGPGFTISAARVKELSKLLGSVKHLPKQESTK